MEYNHQQFTPAKLGDSETEVCHGPQASTTQVYSGDGLWMPPCFGKVVRGKGGGAHLRLGCSRFIIAWLDPLCVSH